MKERKGYIFQNNTKWFARITFTDEKGNRRNIKRTAKTKVEAKELLKKISRQIEDGGEKAIEAEKLTFIDLANYYEKIYLVEPNYLYEEKVFGIRDWKRRKAKVKMFCDYFRNRKIKDISYGDLLRFRSERLNILTKDKKIRTITTINRELAYLRRVFNIALREGWILKNPFNCGESLIQISAEKRRTRILTIEEESRLLAACEHPQRKHLKPFLVALLSTGCRKSEITLLTWRFVNFDNRLITIRALNTKTLRSRKVAITQSLYNELNVLWEKSDKNLDSLVFGIKDNVRKSFSTACRIAGIIEGGTHGLTLHSLRHTAATRLVKGNLPIQMVGRILGHSQPQTTYRYLSANDETLYQAASILESLQQNNDSEIESELIN